MSEQFEAGEDDQTSQAERELILAGIKANGMRAYDVLCRLGEIMSDIQRGRQAGMNLPVSDLEPEVNEAIETFRSMVEEDRVSWW